MLTVRNNSALIILPLNIKIILNEFIDHWRLLFVVVVVVFVSFCFSIVFIYTSNHENVALKD